MPGTLLLADDSITIQKVVELTFAETEHKVVAVGSGRDLFKRLPEVKPDVVLCDVVMPDMNGYEVCQTLKSDPATLHIPVVLLTGTFEPFDRDRALAAGCDAIVTKPFEARDLISTVEDLITRAKAMPAASAESGALGEHGTGEGVPSFDFSGSGFEKLGPPPPPPVPAPENGIDLTASSLGDSNPPLPRPAPPELQEPAAPPSFAFGDHQPPANAEQPVVTAPAPNAFFPTKPVEPEPPAPVSSPPSFMGEDQGAVPFVAEGPVETAATEAPTVPSDVASPTRLETASVFTPQEPPVPLAAAQPMEEGPTQRLLVKAMVSEGDNEPPPPATGTLSDEEIERIARRAVELIPAPAPEAPQATQVQLTDEQVDRIAKRVVELAAPQLERIAWDVIPDMAEMVVRKRIAELEAAAEEEN
jgi:CheY-like chemotaxis protein